VLAYRHTLGTNPDKADIPWLGYGVSKKLPFNSATESSHIETLALAGQPYILGLVRNGTQRELTLYLAHTDKLKGAATPWQKVCEYKDEITDYAVQGDNLYLLSHNYAPRYRVLHTSLSHPNVGEAEIVVPQGSGVIEDIFAARDALYIQVLERGLHTMSRLPYGPRHQAEPLDLPIAGTIFNVISHPNQAGVLLGLTTWTRWGNYYAYDAAAGHCTPTRLEPQSIYDNPTGLEAREVLVKSHDGTMVPLSIICKEGLKLDGSHPTMLQAYGAYGTSAAPAYRVADLAYLERGGVLATAHVRGGSELGETWYQAGFQSTKANSWLDLLACAEYLIKEDYTTARRLAGRASGAGGIALGRAITERPELFAAAIFEGAMLDMLRQETTASGGRDVAEFGSVTTREGFHSLWAMSTCHQMKEKSRYPAILFTHGINDRSVEVWQSAKAAALFQASRSRKPTLLRIDYEGGHGATTNASQNQLEADIAAFFFQHTGGLPEPVPGLVPDLVNSPAVARP
jgi:prolyl oligopeptidase